ncbi:ComEC/Rec2 family competence protein [Mesoflavibacter zeaxanthinifaciens]|uniref:ComEC/Rec2 family competence protein n=1 Tax=Mesoflavibacter zeaxanthinifaciens TaxID=393060 RepID=UPI003A95B19C
MIFGILLSEFFLIEINYALVILIFSFVITTGTYFIFKNKYKNTFWFGFSAIFTCIILGVFVSKINNSLLEKSHFFHFKEENQKPQLITFKVKEFLKPNAFSDRYYIEILKVDHQKTNGKALLNIEKDSTTNSLKVDNIYTTKTEINDIKSPLNPDQFSYKNYLKNQQVFYQLYSKDSELFLLNNNTNTLRGHAANFRNLINKKLKNYNFTKDELSIINALILGQRQGIDKDLYDSYTNAGAIHILAVSGLHVGIILLILSFVLKPLERIKHGYFIKTIVILLLLWSYAIIAGNSASIVRATTMFSIVAIGLNLKRTSNIYNTLATSIFVLLLIKPSFIFDVGFQLSYAAVFSIVSIQPIIEPLVKPKNKLLNLLWKTLTVTVSAQFGIIPISLYYFHQFPSLFWLSNLVVIPVLGVILGLGLLVITLALIDLLPEFLADMFAYIIRMMNTFFEWIARQESFLFQDISFNIFQVILSYILIFTLYKFYLNRKAKWVFYSLALIIGFQANFIFNTSQNKGESLYVFHKSKHTIIGKKVDKKLQLYSNLEAVETNTIPRTFAVKNSLRIETPKPIQPIFNIKNKTLLVVDSLGVFQVKKLKVDYILLTQSPKINLNRLIDSIKPKAIIADGSNYKSYILRWKSTCLKQKIPFYQTGKTGAFIID